MKNYVMKCYEVVTGDWVHWYGTKLPRAKAVRDLYLSSDKPYYVAERKKYRNFNVEHVAYSKGGVRTILGRK